MKKISSSAHKEGKMESRVTHRLLILMELYILISIGDTMLREGFAAQESQIVFTSERDGNSEIYVMDANGKSIKRLTHHPLSDTQAVWSPDGTRIAFVSNRNGGNIQIFIMDSNGRNPTRLTDGVWDRYPTWSPDGSKIAFAAFPEEFNPEIFVMDADGGNQTRLTNQIGLDDAPSWSPDGQRIAFVSRRGR